ncbi:Outer-membrane lipoprotein carrier protein [bacterium HR40]|nr:Outer-membrane lipoprotein carrier protein [bacterium HR40]
MNAQCCGTCRRLLRAALLLIVALVATGGTTSPATDSDPDVLARVEHYLEGLRSFQARFSQINPDGSVATGTISVERPGRMRVDYDPPSKVLLVATDWRLVFYDGSIRQVNTIPLSQTPLAFLLAEDIDLAKAVRVTEVRETADTLDVRVVRAEAPDQGSLTLHFSTRPFELRSWTVIDPQGLATQVVLEDLRTNLAFDRELFHWRDPAIFGLPDD